MSRYRQELGLMFAILICLVTTSLVDVDHNYWRDPYGSATDIIRQTSLLGIFSLGAALVIISGGIDLSSGAMIAFGGTICSAIMLALDREAMLAAEPVSKSVILIAVLGTLLVGFLVGSLHVWLITIVGLPPFVATLGTLVGLRSLSWALVVRINEGNSQINIFDEDFRYVTCNVWFCATLFLTLALIIWVLLGKTVTGRHIYAVGGNEQAAKLSGIRTERIKWLAYSLSAMLSALAGIFYVGDQSTANPQTLGRGYELYGIASAVVGGCSLQGGLGTIQGTVLGALFLKVVMDGVAKIIKTGADKYEGLLVGGVIIVAVALNQLRTGGIRKRLFPGALGLVNILNLSLLAAGLTALMGHDLLGRWLPVGANPLGAVVGGVTLLVLSSIYWIEARREKK